MPDPPKILAERNAFPRLGAWSDRRIWESRPVFVTTHVLSGLLIGRVLKKRPAAALPAGIGSHLVLDAIPHWGCRSGRTHFLTVAERTDCSD
jgi:hypothetical protein